MIDNLVSSRGCFVVLLMASAVMAAAPPSASHPDAGPWTWHPRAGSVQIGWVAAPAGGPASKVALRVSGRMTDGWNYVATGRVPVKAGGLYRLSAEVLVDRLGAGTPPPFLKCEFVGEDTRQPMGQVRTNSYDSSKPGAWQPLSVEFQAPEGATACWLALEKGTNAPTEIQARLRDVRLGPISRLSVLDQFRLDPPPAPLKAVSGVHPRLFLDAKRVEALRPSIKSTHADIWRKLKAEADRLVRQGPPRYREDDGRGGDEQLWQRSVGNAMPTIALAYLMTGEKSYLDSATAWALASCGYPTWGLGRIDGMDLAAGHQLMGLGLVYDWCHGDLDPAARKTIRQTLEKRASAMYQAAATGKVWWRRSLLQNHLWVDSAGMAVAGLALFDEVDEASAWIGFPLSIFRETRAALGTDGASHEGVGYWEYGVENLLKFNELARTLLDVELGDGPWWSKTSTYPLYLSLPRHAWTRSNCIVDLADCPRGHWYGPDYLLRDLARRQRDGHAQWLAAEVDRSNTEAPGAPWLNLLWYDPTVSPRPPTDLPTLHHFDDMGIVSARSDWSGDESLVVSKCGPFIGHDAIQRFDYDPGGGHVHPDANHFVIFGAGEWQVRDDGYQPKSTRPHNTLLVDGVGQMGEGRQWFDGGEPLARKARPRVVGVESTPAVDHWTGDATAAYAPERKLTRFVRHLVFIKPDVLIVADDVETAAPASLELRFHTEADLSAEGRAHLGRGKKSVLRIEPLTTEEVTVTAEREEGASEGHRAGVSMPTVRLARRGRQWRNAVALSWSPSGQAPRAITLERRGDRWTFSGGPTTVTLDWTTGRVSP